MQKLIIGCLLPLLLVALSASAAVTVVECVDADGNSSFRDKCPPGVTKKGDKTLLGVNANKPKSTAEIAANNPVMLYTIPNCDACDLVRAALTSRSVPINEKNVQDNAANQEELKNKTSSMTVPTMIVGTNILTGYNRSAIDNALNQVGYPPPASTAAASGAAAPLANP